MLRLRAPSESAHYLALLFTPTPPLFTRVCGVSVCTPSCADYPVLEGALRGAFVLTHATFVHTHATFVHTHAAF